MLSPCQVSNEAHLFPLHESDLARADGEREEIEDTAQVVEIQRPHRNCRSSPGRSAAALKDSAPLHCGLGRGLDRWRMDVCISYERLVSRRSRTVVSSHNQTRPHSFIPLRQCTQIHT